jgi:riboflavin kinase/FMN adenylyltransferase
MPLLTDPAHFPLGTPAVLTIGNFDGVHKGHQSVIHHLIELAHSSHSKSVVFTFSNHPKEILAPQIPLHKLCTSTQKNNLLMNLGVDFVITVPFTEQFADQDPDQFLALIRQSIPFSHLILGHDATFGKGRSGKPEVIKQIAVKQNFSVTYLPPLIDNEEPISSSRIRKALLEGKFDESERLLGRKYSMEGEIIHGQGRGKSIGFPTANLMVIDYALPPFGVYQCETIIDGTKYSSIGNIGIAPTVRKDQIPILEIHIFDFESDLYGKRAEVTFLKFIREERKFATIDDLKRQLHEDMSYVRSCTR